MKIVKKILIMAAIVVGMTFTVSAQKDDQKKPPKNPPVIDPGKKPPRGNPPPRPNDQPKPRPGMAMVIEPKVESLDVD